MATSIERDTDPLPDRGYKQMQTGSWKPVESRTWKRHFARTFSTSMVNLTTSLSTWIGRAWNKLSRHSPLPVKRERLVYKTRVDRPALPKILPLTSQLRSNHSMTRDRTGRNQARRASRLQANVPTTRRRPLHWGGNVMHRTNCEAMTEVCECGEERVPRSITRPHLSLNGYNVRSACSGAAVQAAIIGAVARANSLPICTSWASASHTLAHAR
jgi:hypothetical protein